MEARLNSSFLFDRTRKFRQLPISDDDQRPAPAPRLEPVTIRIQKSQVKRANSQIIVSQTDSKFKNGLVLPPLVKLQTQLVYSPKMFERDFRAMKRQRVEEVANKVQKFIE
ncbi:Hypothetical_protein [Hexamita inflata]|uniref:Hypothetical_protein n=1 Tax=Hexamita inflata TaxID=28002 RepID=A0AA86UIE6_9EUKA|nr:Hypothetical protein HINF_LOCUS38179 [Hexamita inflata]CAI9959500.1 Hypothetical protein HINF_LOCUS47145 [Hexamita inflata]